MKYIMWKKATNSEETHDVKKKATGLDETHEVIKKKKK